MDFLDQFAKARAQIKTYKKHIPHMFPQWQRLQNAKSDLEKAKLEYKRAKAAWDKLGAQ